MRVQASRNRQRSDGLQRSRVTTDADAGIPEWLLPRVRVLQRSRVTTDADARDRGRRAFLVRMASTEPRHDGRGCLAPSAIPPGGKPCFNGAASRRTRMPYWRMRSDSPPRCFNGAASRRTRMPLAASDPLPSEEELQRSRVTTDADALLCVRGPDGDQLASTEPRHDGRGCALNSGGRRSGGGRFNGAASRRTRMRGKSWPSPAGRRSFNGAASRRTRMLEAKAGPAAASLASTEPRHDGRGCAAGRPQRNGAPEASTEPRHDGRGCRSGDGASRSGCHASTEPRHDGRGCA